MRATRLLITLLFTALVTTPGAFAAEKQVAQKTSHKKKSHRLSDAQIKKRLIEESIAAYPGRCPCPYNTASNGSSCGGRSAWSRAGGESPLCYVTDISAEMVEEYRNTHEKKD